MQNAGLLLYSIKEDFPVKSKNAEICVNGYGTEEGRADSSKLPAVMAHSEGFKGFVSLLPSGEKFIGAFPADYLPSVLCEYVEEVARYSETPFEMVVLT